MKQFNLEEWLQDKSRKVVTRDGRPVRIICTDANEETPIAVLVTVNDMGQDKLATALYTKDGRYGSGNSSYDLFFADEEEELTELQKTLEEDCDYYVKLYNEGYTREELREWIKCWCHCIIDLARKEIEKENPYSGNQKQEWSEEDKKKQDAIIGILDFQANKAPGRCCATDGFLLDELIDWLKSFKPQPEQEWSEEDKSMYIRTLGILGKCYMGELPTKVEEELNWFKSIEPKSHWKPSDEQMEALFEAKLASIKNREYFLGLLYEDLKKL